MVLFDNYIFGKRGREYYEWKMMKIKSLRGTNWPTKSMCSIMVDFVILKKKEIKKNIEICCPYQEKNK